MIFALAGYSESDASLQNWLPFQPTLSDRLDLLTARGLLGAGIILVMPDCFTAYGGSQYMNSPAAGPYDDYLVQELVPYIDRTYRTLGEGRRGIFGKSMGGTARCEVACCILTSGVLLLVTAAICSSNCAMPVIFPPFARPSNGGQKSRLPGVGGRGVGLLDALVSGFPGVGFARC